MSHKPILVIQMQRLGDLILSFPLLRDILTRYPNNPLYVAAEPIFYKGLQAGLPAIQFISPQELPKAAGRKHELLINLSHRQDAAAFAQKIPAEVKYGAIASGGTMRMLGYWQLYRAALTQNNRHNAFHWADLNRLDLGFPLSPVKHNNRTARGSRRIGLFIGASDAAKRPDIPFWVELAKRLMQRGFAPILLGGPNEKDAGRQIANLANLNPVNFCGRTSISGLCEISKTLDLFITPDTGPMHLADWLGAPVLNLSMGNVHARETGPVSPGQWIARANLSCVGCWQCSRPKLYCKQAFQPKVIANLACDIIAGNSLRGPGLEILKTGRDADNLYNLENVNSLENCRKYLENFWQSAFLFFYNSDNRPRLQQMSAALAHKYPELAQNMRKNFKAMLAALSMAFKHNQALPDHFWQNQPWHSRLFAGHVQMCLQNEDGARSVCLAMLERINILQELLGN